MKSSELKLHQEIMYLHYGTKADLARASVNEGTVLSTDRFNESRWERCEIDFNGNTYKMQGIRHEKGNRAAILRRNGTYGYVSLIPFGRILGPTSEWKPQIEEIENQYKKRREEATEKELKRRDDTVAYNQRLADYGLGAHVSLYHGHEIRFANQSELDYVMDLIERNKGLLS